MPVGGATAWAHTSPARPTARRPPPVDSPSPPGKGLGVGSAAVACNCLFESETLKSCPMPTWVLALMYWLHLLATVVWVGGLVLLALVVGPGARARLGPGPEFGRLVSELHQRFNPWAWGSLVTLVATGMFQMAADPHYDGFLQIDQPWAVAMLAKHLAVVGMVGLGALSQWGVQPALARLALLEARGLPTPGLPALRRREAMLTWANLACAMVVLLCTAIATAL